MTAQPSRPGVGTEATGAPRGAVLNPTEDLQRETVGSRISQADDALGHVCDALDAGRLRLDELYMKSPNAARLFWRGFDAGIAAQAERVRQAEHTADRLYVLTRNPAEQARIVDARMTRAIAAMPPDVELHSPDYFENALRAVIGGAA